VELFRPTDGTTDVSSDGIESTVTSRSRRSSKTYVRSKETEGVRGVEVADIKTVGLDRRICAAVPRWAGIRTGQSGWPHDPRSTF
jgi:hypothetical protein